VATEVRDGPGLGVAVWVLEALRCPQPHHARLEVDHDRSELVCRECGLAFPVRDGVPLMLVDRARRVGSSG
jgi:hypothetical protein